MVHNLNRERERKREGLGWLIQAPHNYHQLPDILKGIGIFCPVSGWIMAWERKRQTQQIIRLWKIHS